LDQEVKKVVYAWLAAQPKTFISEGIRKLVQRWTRCIESKEITLKNDVNVSFLFILK
jgi:hypothetical protein